MAAGDEHGDAASSPASALCRLLGVRLEGSDGAGDDEGWWHITMVIDEDVDGARPPIAVLAKVLNSGHQEGGNAVFKPSARLRDTEFDADRVLG